MKILANVLTRLLLAAVSIAVSSVVLVSLRGSLPNAVVALLYLLVVVLCTTIGGLTAGTAAAVFAFLAFNYLFLPPYNTFFVHQPQDIIAMFVFLTVAVIISNLMGRAQARLEQIQQRERESAQLFELGSSLTAARDETEIAGLLARSLLEVFQAGLVEVLVQPDYPAGRDAPPVRVRLPEGAQPGAMYRQVQPLATTRGALGEIQFWTRQEALSPGETRLLQTIAGQVALALERALLARAENRARVLEESDRLKTAILSSVSHDLRTPLSSIQAAASLLYDSSFVLEPKARDELLSLLLEESEHLNQLVGNLLNMSRIEAGALKLQKQWNSMAELIDTAVGRMQRHVTRHEMIIDVSEDLPLVQIDALLLEQVFINLISNSLKYSPPGTRIRIEAFVRDAAWMQVELRNQGPAIPDEHLEHIFEKFYTYPGMRQDSSTGLGLSICKGIVEAHGGRIWAANLPAGGLAFCFTLPLSKAGLLSILPEESAAGGPAIPPEGA